MLLEIAEFVCRSAWIWPPGFSCGELRSAFSSALHSLCVLLFPGYFVKCENRGVVGTQVCTNHIHDKNTRWERVLELSLEALFKFILLESKDLLIYLFFCFFLKKKEKIED